MKVSVNSSDSERISKYSERYGITIFSSTILDRREVDEGEIKYYLEEDIIYQHSPFTVDDVYSAIERIDEALDTTDNSEGEEILIFGDRDVDGITSTAIIYKTLKKLGAKNISCRLPLDDESYGLTDTIVDEIIKDKVGLVITVDNGITAIDEIKKLEKNGVSVIVLDHHIPLDILPPAEAIFNPKVEGSGYPFSDLAGCAVSAKLAWALFFSRTPLWNSRVILLHAEPGNGTIRISGVKLENLVETERCYDEFVEGEKGSFYSSPLFSFLVSNTPIFVLDKDTEYTLLRKAFGKGIDISLEDFRENMERVIPSTRGRSLFELSLRSRASRYTEGPKELETLISLFRSTSIYSFSSLTKDFEEIMVLEAIGTIADLMPLKNENRLIVKKGLKILSTRPPVTLSMLLSRQNLIAKNITATNVSYKIAPILNSSGRMGRPNVALSLLLSNDPMEIEKLTEELFSFNSERQRMEEEALNSIETKALDSLKRTNGKLIIVEDSTIKRGLTGSLASKLANENGIPAIVMARLDDVVFGSMRCFDPWNARDFLSNFSYLLEDYGGHRYAAGLRVTKEKNDKLIELMASYASTYSVEEEKEKAIRVDAILDKDDLKQDVWKAYSLFSPYGQESPELKFYISNAVIRELYHVGNSDAFMRFSLEIGNYIWPGVWWNANESSKNLAVGKRVEIIFSPEINWWKGQGREQLNIVSIEALE